MSDVVTTPSTPSTSVTTQAPSAGSPTSAAPKVPGSVSAAGTSSGAPAGTLPPPDSKVVRAEEAEKAKAAESEAQAQSAAEAQRRRAYRLKVDGKEIDYDLDAKSEEEVTRDLQLSLAARQRMQETAAQTKRLTDVVALFRNDPWAAAKELGLDLDAMAEARLGAKFREASMTEEEKARLALERERDSYKAKAADLEKAAQERTRAELEAKVFAETQAEVKAAFDEAKIPWTPGSARLMAEVARANLDYGVELSAKQLASEVRSQLTGIASEVIKGLKGDELLGFLGTDAVREVLRVSVAKVRKPTDAPAATAPAGSSGSPELDDRGRLKRQPKDFRKAVAELRYGA